MSSDRAAPPPPPERKPTHLCLDCGAVGYAGGYHGHGNGDVGDMAPIAEVLRLLGEAGTVRDERDAAEAAIRDFVKVIRDHRKSVDQRLILCEICRRMNGPLMDAKHKADRELWSVLAVPPTHGSHGRPRDGEAHRPSQPTPNKHHHDPQAP